MEFENNGNFSVHSVYRMIVDIKKRREDWLEQRDGASNNSDNDKA